MTARRFPWISAIALVLYRHIQYTQTNWLYNTIYCAIHHCAMCHDYNRKSCMGCTGTTLWLKFPMLPWCHSRHTLHVTLRCKTSVLCYWYLHIRAIFSYLCTWNPSGHNVMQWTQWLLSYTTLQAENTNSQLATLPWLAAANFPGPYNLQPHPWQQTCIYDQPFIHPRIE